MSKHAALPVVVVTAALGVLAPTAGAAGNPDVQGPALSAALGELNAQLKLLSDQSGKAGEAGRNLQTRRAAITKALGGRRVCDGADGLRALRRSARGATAAPAEIRAGVLAASLNAEIILRSRTSTGGCAHAARGPATVGFARALTQDASGLTARFQLPAMRFAPVDAGDRALVQPVPGGMTTSAVGKPAIPFLTRLVAIPEGARLSVSVKGREGFMVDNVDVAQQQPDPNAQSPTGDLSTFPGSDSPLFASPAYRYDASVADSSTPYPSRLATVKPLGTWNGLRIAAISVPTAQVLGKSRRMWMLTSADIQVRFTGGASTFGVAHQVAAGAEELKALSPLVVNLKAATGAGALKKVELKPCGGNLAIITTPALREAADELAQIKRAAGMSTIVTEVGPGADQAGATATAISSYLAKLRTSNCNIPLRNVILYGKAVPSFLRTSQRKNAGEPNHATDYPYGLLFPGIDVLPVNGVGRLPAKTVAEGHVMNEKIKAWMASGPPAGDFYSHALVAGQFQHNSSSGATKESQTFITALEATRNVLRTSGRTVDRFYDQDAGANPKKFQDGSSFPADLLSYPWSTPKGDQIKAAIDEGRSLVIHESHGFNRGWGLPAFNADTHVPNLTNGAELPLVWSINCYSGRYDDPNIVSFAEEMVLKSGGGALAVLASSRMSNTYTNGVFVVDLAKTLFPQVVPGIPSFQGVRRLGSNVNAAKIRVFVDLYGDGSNPGAATDLMNMYNLFGDPTLKYRVFPGEPGM